MFKPRASGLRATKKERKTTGVEASGLGLKPTQEVKQQQRALRPRALGSGLHRKRRTKRARTKPQTSGLVTKVGIVA